MAGERSGDDGQRSFATLFARNRDRFVRIARKLRGRRGAEAGADTMDYVQDASAEYLRKEREVHSESHFLNLFAGFIKNALRGRRRTRDTAKRGGSHQHVDLPMSAAMPADTRTGPRTSASRHEACDLVADRLRELSDEDQAVIKLRLWEDLGFEDIATRLDLASADAARKRYARALERLEGKVPEL